MADWSADDRRTLARLLARFTEAFEGHIQRATEPGPARN
jgi:hypothetical protein